MGSSGVLAKRGQTGWAYLRKGRGNGIHSAACNNWGNHRGVKTRRKQWGKRAGRHHRTARATNAAGDVCGTRVAPATSSSSTHGGCVDLRGGARKDDMYFPCAAAVAAELDLH
ncbi:hypothetical protein ABZP36_004355 [Zizania latifolia]